MARGFCCILYRSALLVVAWLPSLGQTQVPLATVRISISTSASTPVEPGFAGYNVALMDSGLQPTDSRLVAVVTKLTPGWLKYPAGARTNAFDWSTGQYRKEWVDRFVGTF